MWQAGRAGSVLAGNSASIHWRFSRSRSRCCLGLGAPLFVPASALGLEDKKPASERLTLGFIGMGTQNRGHLNHFLGQKEVQVVAVCDVDTSRREAAKKTVEQRYGKEKKDGQY